MAGSLGELISEFGQRGYVFVWQLDGLLEEPALEAFQLLEAAGIDVVREGEQEIPEVVGVYLDSCGEAKRLSKRRESALASHIIGGGLQADRAKKELFESSLRMAAFTAVRWSRPGVEPLDRIIWANNLLMRAVKNFDFARGSNFTSYATWFVRHEMRKRAAK